MKMLMTRRVGVGIICLAARLLAVTQSFASDIAHCDNVSQPAPDVRALKAEVDQLRAEVKALRDRSRQPPEPAKSRPAPDVPALSDEVMQDADRRSSLLNPSALTAGWGNDLGFFLRSQGGAFVLSPFVLLQVRNATSWRDDSNSGRDSDTENGFEIRRLQLGLNGNLFTPDLTYRIFWQSSELTAGNLSLLMAWVQYRFHDTPWVVGGGQFKDPLDHEQLISDARQLACDRTFVDDTLAGGEAFSRGVTIRYDPRGPLRAEAALTSGFNVPNTTFQQFPTNPADFGVAARGEYKVFGDWKDYEQFTSLADRANLLVIGGGADLTEAGHTQTMRHVIDAQCNFGPLGLYASYLGRYTRGNTIGRGGDTYDPSARVQASYLFARHWEPFARYDYMHLDGREFKASTQSTVHELTAGANYYFYGQALKATVDVSYLPNGAPFTDAGNDILQNSGHRELIWRAQLQLLF